MAYVNPNYLKLKAGYLFPEIGRRVKAFAAANPGDAAKIIRMGIGDVTEPLPAACIAAMHRAVDDQATHERFHGYGPEQGYDFLREAIAKHDFQSRGCDIAADEIFVSDGSKCDTGNFLEILASRDERSAAASNTIAMTDPVYPVYVDTNVMVGNTGAGNERGEYEGLVYLPMTAENKFTPPIPHNRVDVIYLCSPNNPTGAVLDKHALAKWVVYAREHGSLILFDAAYESYITDPAIPHSIYEIEGARDVAVEFRSFSKTAGFTGTRCAYSVVPKTVTGVVPEGRDPSHLTGKGDRVDLHRLWMRRHTTKFNGVSYIVQRGAEAVYTPAGREQVKKTIAFYLENARIIRETLASLGLQVFGGVNAPYVWVKTPGAAKSWEFFDRLLKDAHVVITPGSGFGAAGEGYFRVSAFNSRENVNEAMGRFRKMLG